MIIQLQKNGTYVIIRAGCVLITGCNISIAILLAMAARASGGGMTDRDIPFDGRPMPGPPAVSEWQEYF